MLYFNDMDTELKRGFFKNQSKPRKTFRVTLLLLLLFSVGFCATMITLRVNKQMHWYVVKNYQDEIFTADVYGQNLIAMFQDDREKFQTASLLLQKNFFSPIYGKAGVLMMRDLADDGHAPAQTLYGDLLLHSPYLADHKEQAKHYYSLAAAQNYLPAKHKLAAAE